MIIEIVSIGDELLKGQILNTNAAFICSHLQQRGYGVLRQTTLSDEENQLKSGLIEALQRSDLVIATGGLGPTLDDHTREIAAEIFECGFHNDSKYEEELKCRFPKRFAAVQDQARIPTKAQMVTNSIGSAPGLFFVENDKALLLMPGVPKEMEPMFINYALPLIVKQWPLNKKKHIVQLFFCLIYESLLDPHLRELSARYCDVEAGIYPSYGTLSVVLVSSSGSQLAAFEKELRHRFNQYIFDAQSGKIEEALHTWFVRHKKTIACAESCTGGNIACHITSVAGCSDYFLGSFVVYSEAMKQQILGVSSETMRTKGVFSSEVVQEMLNGVFNHSRADWAIAVTGIAGPGGGSEDLPVGTMWGAIGARGSPPDVGTFMTFGNRQTRILLATNQLLGALWRKVEKGVPAFPFLS